MTITTPRKEMQTTCHFPFCEWEVWPCPHTPQNTYTPIIINEHTFPAPLALWHQLYTCLPNLSVLSHFPRGVYAVGSRPSAGVQTVRASSIDVLAFHLAVLGIAMLIGYGLKQGLIAIESTSQKLKDLNFLSGIPLFPLCMAGGIIIQVRRLP